MLVDTHCHIQEADYPLDPLETLARARAAGVSQMICVGTSEDSSRRCIEFAAKHPEVFASIGIHPHETSEGYDMIGEWVSRPKLVAIGEIGLDYFYTHSPRETQLQALQWQMELAITHNLPIIFHVREAFADFWPLFDSFTGIRGVLHSFTDTQANLDKALTRGLFIGVNGISTFTKDEAQKAMFQQIPLERLLLETDAPFLTPVPLRGKVNEPAFVKNVAQHHAEIRHLPLSMIADATTTNARALFAL